MKKLFLIFQLYCLLTIAKAQDTDSLETSMDEIVVTAQRQQQNSFMGTLPSRENGFASFIQK